MTVGCASSQHAKLGDASRLQALNLSLSNDVANLGDQQRNIAKDLQQQKDLVGSLQDQRDSLQKQLLKLSNLNYALEQSADSSKTKQILEYKGLIASNQALLDSIHEDLARLEKENAALKMTISGLSGKQGKLAKDDTEIARLKEVERTLKNRLQQEIADNEMIVKQIDDILNIDLVDRVFFDSGSAEMKIGGKKVLDRIVTVLKSVTNKLIRIEGSTDNVPISEIYQWKYPSNWELSTARAVAIVRYFQSQGIDPKLMKAAGYGEYNPVAVNTTEAGRAKNRRIAILLFPMDERSRVRK
jgi:chemotaxis protein MotB